MANKAMASVVYGVVFGLVLLGAAWVIKESPAAMPAQGARIGVTENGDSVFVEVKAGDTAADIGRRLAAAGVIRNAATFELLASATGAARSLAAGEYEFEPGTSALDALSRIRGGLTSARVVTVAEGLRTEEIAALLERRGIVSARDFLAAAQTEPASPSPSLAALLAGRPRGRGPDGYLYPATYSFPRRATAREIVDTMLKALDERLTPELREEARRRGLTIDQVLTIASIVEREVVHGDERPVVASVYLNRLRLDMPLQADPTVQYAITARPANITLHGFWKPTLTLQDLQFDSPYNTYAKTGLPPGPIANPGIDSIIAVIRPATTDYLYFVARPDGRHVFATTFAEHQRNVDKYQPQ